MASKLSFPDADIALSSVKTISNEELIMPSGNDVAVSLVKEEPSAQVKRGTRSIPWEVRHEPALATPFRFRAKCRKDRFPLVNIGAGNDTKGLKSGSSQREGLQ